jgi:hypothetical protein
MSAMQSPVQLDLEDAIAEALRRRATSEDISLERASVSVQTLPAAESFTSPATRVTSQPMLPLPVSTRRLNPRQVF